MDNDIRAEELHRLYLSLKDLFKEEEAVKTSVKDEMESLRESIAMALEIIKSTGEPDRSKVKSKLVKTAIEVLTEDRNRLEEEMDLMESYLEVLKEKKNSIDSLLRQEEELKEIKTVIREKKKDLKYLVPDPFALDIIINKAKEKDAGFPSQEKIEEIRELVKIAVEGKGE